ncbi:MAG TPA: toll/interleukin-1 receptor domain-containing protein [Streptosporangiaceae bacterium]|nr:toll/interleukin-1 receptor domain-containing protein [Streptosporangiaceae bacterium]
MDPHSFTVIVQSQSADGDEAVCHGFPQLAAVQPCRVLVVGDAETTSWRGDLVGILLTQLSSTAATSGLRCDGPGALRCWATAEIAARNLLVVVAGEHAPSARLSEFVDGWRTRGFETVGVFRADLNPDHVLPQVMLAQHAPSWQADIREVAAEIVDSVVLCDEERRVFVSYSHAGGSAIAERLVDVLTRLRFDVFLDRFRLAPGTDFVERIADELVDKAMIVVVETPQAVRSPWERHEVSTAVSRRLGLVALHLGTGPAVAEIDERARCRVDDDNAIGAFLLEQHRNQLRERREALLDSVWHSLRRAGLAVGQIKVNADGFSIGSHGHEYVLTVRPRPADLHRFRLAHERAGQTMDAVVIHPQPMRIDRRRDLGWLCDSTGVIQVDEGLIDVAASQIEAGTL